MITNELTHTSHLMQYPGYTPVERVTAYGGGAWARDAQFHANAAFFHRVGEWFTLLKENGVYDNTRIIIVADHGSGVDTGIAETALRDFGKQVENFNPLLMMKDFNAHGPLAVDNTFMTNADVPVMALAGVIDNPVNPFTGNPLISGAKADGVTISVNDLHQAHYHPKYVFKTTPDEWVFVHDNIFDPANWTRADLGAPR